MACVPVRDRLIRYGDIEQDGFPPRQCHELGGKRQVGLFLKAGRKYDRGRINTGPHSRYAFWQPPMGINRGLLGDDPISSN